MSGTQNITTTVNEDEYRKWFENGRDEKLQSAFFITSKGKIKGGAKAKVEWFGLVIELDNDTTKDVSTITAAAGSIATYVAAVAPPIAAAIQLYLVTEAALIHAANRGDGVVLTMIWITPGVFVPTAR